MLMADHVVFSSTFEALVRALGPKLDESGKARFKAIGVDFDARLLPAYTQETWLSAMQIGSDLLMPGESKEAQYYNLGHRIVASFAETMVGRALVAMMRVIGPRRALGRMTRNLRAANNFTETSFAMLDDGRCAVTCSPIVSTEFFRGLFTGSVEAAGGSDVRVELLSVKEGTGTFSISWK